MSEITEIIEFRESRQLKCKCGSKLFNVDHIHIMEEDINKIITICYYCHKPTFTKNKFNKIPQ